MSEHGTPRVRRAGGQDADTVAGLLGAFATYLGYDGPSPGELRARVAPLIAAGSADYLLGELAGGHGAVAVCGLRYRPSVWLDGEDCLLEDLYVTEAARGAGMGRAMVAAALDRARARGAARVELDTNEANVAAIALYGSFGFVAENGSYDGARDLYLRVHL